nr:hypothetical protein CFP56_37227 [Quercus suber]
MSSDAVRSITFDEASIVTQISSHEYGGKVHRDFSFGPAAHGGFLISLCWKAVARHFATTLAKYGQLDTISLHVEFLRPGTNGPVEVKLNDLRLGKGSSTVSFSLRQNGKEVIAGFATCVLFHDENRN